MEASVALPQASAVWVADTARSTGWPRSVMRRFTHLSPRRSRKSRRVSIYKVTKPCYDERQGLEGIEAEFQEVVRILNAKFNPGGVPWKGEKRTQPDAGTSETSVTSEKYVWPMPTLSG